MNIIKKITSLYSIKLLMLLFASTIFLSACDNSDPSDKSPEQLAEEQRDCWQANILGMLYDYMGSITMTAYENLTEGAMNVMMVIFSIWFAFQMMKQLGSIKEEEPTGKFWTGILKKFFLCFACGYLASSSTGLIYVLNSIIFPVFNAFLELASYLLAEVAQLVQSNELSVFGEAYSGSQDICSTSSQLKYAPTTDSGFPEGSNAMMQCLVCNISSKLNLGFMLSYTIMKAGLFLPKVIGFTILCIFTFVKLGFVFYLVETVFKFTMMVVMLPIFLLGFPFEQTRKWMTEGIKIILSGAAYILAISVTISLSLIAIVQIIISNPEIFGADADTFVEFNPALMVLLMIGFLVKKTMGVAGEIATTFTGSKITSKFQEALAGVLKMALQGAATIISMSGLGPVFLKINKIEKIYKNIQKVKKRVDEAKKKLNELSGGRAFAEDDGDEDGEENN
ncbi:MAG: hypothetical protein R3Y43_08510 [Alphaproteobacteria bacterium]